VGASTAGALSGNGSIVAFESGASNLVPFDTNSLSDVFVRLRSTGDTQRVSVDTGGGDANAFSGAPDISGDGAKVVF
jgi:Tol biopolymer transport system component